MGQFHFEPSTYLELIRAEVPLYDELQERVAAAAADGIEARRILELGAGTGETTRRLRERFPDAWILATDASAHMLERLDGAETLVRRIEEPLPDGRFDLVVSALAVHHLDCGHKRDLFARVFAALCRGGRFVLGDVVAVDEPVAPLTPEYDLPDRAADQVEWLRDAGFDARLEWEAMDLALLVADRP